VLVSRSRDGEIVAGYLSRFGLDSVRGSTSQGGREAGRALVAAVRRGCDVAVVPDGPRGPCGQLQPGVVTLASLTGAPIVPLAVSVGEAIAAGPLVDGLRRLCPERPLVVTTVTETGARVVRERYAGLAIHRFFPLDLPGATRRFVAAVDPAFLVCLETELWPNMLRTLAARDIPVMIANGRISDRAYRRYRLLGGFMGSVLAEVRVFAMQSDEDARRIIALGVSPERVVVTGNIKNEALPDTAGSADLWRRLLGLRPD